MKYLILIIVFLLSLQANAEKVFKAAVLKNEKLLILCGNL